MSARPSQLSRWLPWFGALWAVPGLYALLQAGRYVGNGTDLYSYQYPLRATVAGLWRLGQVPVWNPYLLGGVPALAGWQLGVLYPPHLLHILAPVAATEWMLWLHLAWLGVGYAALIRAWRPSVSPALAVLLAAAPCLSGPTWGHVWAGHVSFVEAWSWLPWAWWATVRFMDSRAARYLPLAATAVGLQLLAGHPQVSYLTMVGWVFVVGARALGPDAAPSPSSSVTLLPAAPATAAGGMVLGAMAVGGALLAAAQLGPTIDLLDHLNRGLSSPLETATSYSAPSSSLWTMLAPQVLGGAATKLSSVSYHETVAFVGSGCLALAVLGLGTGVRGLVLAVGVGFAMLLAPGEHLGLLPKLLGVLPGLGSFRVPGRWVLLAVALLPLLAADGLALCRPSVAGVRKSAAWRSLVLPGAALLACLWLSLQVSSDHGWFADLGLRGVPEALQSARSSAQASLWLAALATGLALSARWRPASATVAVAALLVLSALQGLAFAADHLGASSRRPEASLQWSGPDQAALARLVPDEGRLLTAAPLRQANWGSPPSVRVAGGYEPAVTLEANRLGNLLAGRPPDSYAVNFQGRAPNVGVDRFAVSHLLVDGRDAKTIGAFLDWPLRETLSSGLQVRENPHPRPRFEAISTWVAVADGEEAARRLSAEPGVSVLVSGDGLVPPPGGTPGEVQVARDVPGELELNVTCVAACVAVARDAGGRGWAARVDGQSAPALTADGLFRAVALTAGRHAVSWQYRTPTWPWSILVSGLAWAGVWLVWRRTSRVGSEQAPIAGEPGPAGAAEGPEAASVPTKSPRRRRA